MAGDQWIHLLPSAAGRRGPLRLSHHEEGMAEGKSYKYYDYQSEDNTLMIIQLDIMQDEDNGNNEVGTELLA